MFSEKNAQKLAGTGLILKVSRHLKHFHLMCVHKASNEPLEKLLESKLPKQLIFATQSRNRAAKMGLSQKIGDVKTFQYSFFHSF